MRIASLAASLRPAPSAFPGTAGALPSRPAHATRCDSAGRSKCLRERSAMWGFDRGPHRAPPRPIRLLERPGRRPCPRRGPAGWPVPPPPPPTHTQSLGRTRAPLRHFPRWFPPDNAVETGRRDRFDGFVALNAAAAGSEIPRSGVPASTSRAASATTPAKGARNPGAGDSTPGRMAGAALPVGGLHGTTGRSPDHRSSGSGRQGDLSGMWIGSQRIRLGSLSRRENPMISIPFACGPPSTTAGAPSPDDSTPKRTGTVRR